MSLSASWLAWAVDWSDSEMFDNSNEGVRLAWVELMCAAKAQGRAGRVRIRVSKFAEQKRLKIADVEECLVRAVTFGAVTREGDEVCAVNWRSYQDPKVRGTPQTTTQKPKRQSKLAAVDHSFSKSAATEHRAQSTDHRSQPEEQRARPARDSGVRVDVTEEVLRDPKRLAVWISQEAARIDGWISTSEADRLNVNATASKALRAKAVRSPVGLFKWIVRGKRWEYLRFDDDKLAATLLASEPGKERTSIAEFVDVPKLELPRDKPTGANLEAIRKAAGQPR